MTAKEIMENHCISLLSVLADDEALNGWRPLSTYQIADMTGVPRRTLSSLLHEVEDRGERALLWSYATKYHFYFKVDMSGPRKISVVRI